MLSHYAEVVVTSFPPQPELVGEVGAVVGISEKVDEAGRPSYGVVLDSREGVIVFGPDEISPTGVQRTREDYY